jgi:hypothetical protein
MAWLPKAGIYRFSTSVDKNAGIIAKPPRCKGDWVKLHDHTGDGK